MFTRSHFVIDEPKGIPVMSSGLRGVDENYD